MHLRKLILALIVLVSFPQSSEASIYAYKRIYKVLSLESQKLNLLAYSKTLLPSPRVLMERMRMLTAVSLLLPLEETLLKSVRDVAAPLIMLTTTKAMALHDMTRSTPNQKRRMSLKTS